MKEKMLIVAGLVISMFLIGSASAKAAPFEGVPHKEFTLNPRNPQINDCTFHSGKLFLLPEGRGIFQGYITSASGKWHWIVKALTFKDISGNRLLTLRDFQSPPLPRSSSQPNWTFEFGFVNAYYDQVKRIGYSNACLGPGQIID
jgi:hypothetical protein